MLPEKYDILLEVARDRRSTRQFKPDPIPEGYIEKILEVARWAPSGFNTQPWEYVVVQKPEVRKKLIEILDRKSPPITKPDAEGHRPSFRDAPAFIILLTDWRAKVGLPGHPVENTPQVESIYCSSQASTFVMMHLAAASLGLASQWYSSASRPETESEIRKLIGFPEDLTIYDMMVVGYPANPPGPKEIRPLTEMIHYDDCGLKDFRTDQQVKAYAEKTWAWCMGEH